MPTVDRGRLDQHERLAPPRPHPSQAEPEQSVRGAETSMETRADTELMTKSEDLEEEVPTRAQGGAKHRNCPHRETHCCRMAGSRAKVNDFLLGRDNGERQGSTTPCKSSRSAALYSFARSE